MRSQGRSRPPARPSRATRWEYLFHPCVDSPYAGQSLSQLQDSGWVIQSTSRSDNGQSMSLLKRARPGTQEQMKNEG